MNALEKVRLYKVRAGWYETTPGEPVDGTVAISAQEDGEGQRYWNLALWGEYPGSPDTGLVLHSTGETFNTLRDARAFLNEGGFGD